MNITEQLKEILGGVKDAASESEWARGFDDFISTGEKCKNTNDNYNDGFKYAKELRGK